ncbi:sialate O-acetylesterase [Aliiglaciecola lipolytica]|uniref:Sialate O-acetylesterase n=1 Tax=Aliiglaciecola lipolytica E3 TaxID=1127673 RepID=K6Y8K9_9ALTE|nr:sialate O-acetylesterase [Aliiglaciecola lipolytica]GAC12983.1 sialate O-acetylesterase [Aliiglaciecola lipolytica E3]
MKNSKLLSCYLAFLFGILPLNAMATLTVASPFSNNAVLQRHMPVPVWGTADAGTKITVTISSDSSQDSQTKSTITNSHGEWKIELDAMPATFTPQVLKISGNESEFTYSNILVGEVWVCAGQSNMVMEANRVPEVKALIPKSKYIRSLEVPRTVALTPQNHLTSEWQVATPSSAVALAFAYHLQVSENVPVGIILSAWGSSSIEAWMPREMTSKVPHFKTMMQEFDADTQTQERIKAILEGPKPWSRKDDIFLRRQSNILFNAMINPLIPYAARGLVWYQGERNTMSIHGMPEEPWFARNSGMLKYGDTLKAWMQNYREAWNQDTFHFIAVMLPGFHKQKEGVPLGGPEDPNTHSWAWMRESQMRSLDLPNTSLVNTIDLGDVNDIHPKDKLPVGKRAALMALRDTLEHNIQAQGPTLSEVKRFGNQIIIDFEHAEGLKTIDEQPPKAFWLSDDSGKWVKAEATIKGQSVILHSPSLTQPRYVRYAFAGKPNVNLVNSANLPAYPFRTDTFEP